MCTTQHTTTGIKVGNITTGIQVGNTTSIYVPSSTRPDNKVQERIESALYESITKGYYNPQYTSIGYIEEDSLKLKENEMKDVFIVENANEFEYYPLGYNHMPMADFKGKNMTVARYPGGFVPESVLPQIKNVEFHDPATIVFWTDGTKTVVKKQDEDKKKKFDPEKGLAMAIAKKYFGNKGRYFENIKKWCE